MPSTAASSMKSRSGMRRTGDGSKSGGGGARLGVMMAGLERFGNVFVKVFVGGASAFGIRGFERMLRLVGR